MLYLIATPIGNLEDLSPRAQRILKEVDSVAAEDTRNTIKLLSHFAISKPLFAFHKFNEKESIPKLVARLQQGENIALVSDAGYPCISDAGCLLTDELRKKNLPFTCLPGPCAVDLALVLSGLDTREYAFLGFLPREGQERQKALAKVGKSEMTAVLYESPGRIRELIADLCPYTGFRRLALLREMTKIHEECLRDTAENLIRILDEREEVKGECVLVVEGRGETSKEEAPSQGMTLEEAAQKVALLKRKAQLPLSQAAQAVALVTDYPRKELYRLAMALEKESED